MYTEVSSPFTQMFAGGRKPKKQTVQNKYSFYDELNMNVGSQK